MEEKYKYSRKMTHKRNGTYCLYNLETGYWEEYSNDGTMITNVHGMFDSYDYEEEILDGLYYNLYTKMHGLFSKQLDEEEEFLLFIERLNKYMPNVHKILQPKF